jgi:hypothetical protein
LKARFQTQKKMAMYDLDAHVAEIYDQVMATEADLALMRRLIGPGNRLRILEPF